MAIILNSSCALSSQEKPVITTLEVHVAKQFVDGVYTSCKDVLMPSANEKAMSMMCGAWGEYNCTAQRWFDFMGSIKNGLAPFQIDYVYVEGSNSTFTTLNKTIIPCNEAVSVSWMFLKEIC